MEIEQVHLHKIWNEYIMLFCNIRLFEDFISFLNICLRYGNNRDSRYDPICLLLVTMVMSPVYSKFKSYYAM